MNPTLVAGSASFSSPTPETLEVTATDHTIVSWEAFSIASQEATHFTLPDATSVILNRVSSALSTEIAGLLTSNGIVYLINPNGILIGPTAQINTASFLASTLDVPNQEFLDGGDLLFSGDSTASLINQGSITSWNGDTILIAYQVNNQQLIEATQGTVSLAAGQEVLLTPEETQRLSIRTHVPFSAAQGTGISQTGTLKAIEVELQADGNLYAYGINQEGWVNATGMGTAQGRIVLFADNGYAVNSGILNASNADGTGGEIHVLGTTLYLADKGEVYVSGSMGGGTILIGGSFQNHDPTIPHAQTTTVDPRVQLSASALMQGNGGVVVVWADDFTGYYGTTRARGGAISGNGGTVEVSGLQDLDFQGTVDTSAPRGQAGTLLMDPALVILSSEIDSSGGLGLVLDPCHLLACLEKNNVQIQSSTDIFIASPFLWEGETSHTLTLQAGRDLYVNTEILNHTTAGTLLLQAEQQLLFCTESQGAATP